MSESAEITVFADGPLKVKGTFVLKDPDGRELDLSGRETVALCRCGHSQNKPFCDASHREQGFKSRVVARKLPPKA